MEGPYGGPMWRAQMEGLCGGPRWRAYVEGPGGGPMWRAYVIHEPSSLTTGQLSITRKVLRNKILVSKS